MHDLLVWRRCSIIYRRYLLPIIQNKFNVGGKFGFCFVKCRKNRKKLFITVMLNEMVKAGTRLLFGLLDYLFLIVIENVSVKSIEIGKIRIESIFLFHQ